MAISSDKLIPLNKHPSRGCPHLVLIYKAELTEAMWIECLVLGHNILMQPELKPSIWFQKPTSYPHEQYAGLLDAERLSIMKTLKFIKGTSIPVALLIRNVQIELIRHCLKLQTPPI